MTASPTSPTSPSAARSAGQSTGQSAARSTGQSTGHNRSTPALTEFSAPPVAAAFISSLPIAAPPAPAPAPECYRGEKLTWDWRGYDLKYVVHGEGPPIVLIHGFGASIGHWRKNIPALAQAGYRVYALDLLGFGESDKPALDYTLDFWVKLLHDFWQVHIQEEAVFVGNSIGGLMALMSLVYYPETAKAGILLNCAGSLNHRPEDLPAPLRLVMGAFSKLVTSKLTGPLVFNQIRTKGRIRNSLKQVYGNRQAITPELVEMLHAPACDPGAQQVFASILTAPPGPRPSELLPQVSQPLLVLWGENDPWTPISAADIYQKATTDPDKSVTFEAIADTGHCPHDERPERVNQLIVDWLAGVLRDGRGLR